MKIAAGLVRDLGSIKRFDENINPSNYLYNTIETKGNFNVRDIRSTKDNTLRISKRR